MARIGFIGGTYNGRNPADSEDTINLFPEQVESGQGQSSMCFIRTSGLKQFCTFSDEPLKGDTPIRGQLTVNQGTTMERTFAISGNTLYELFNDGSYVNRGNIAYDSNPASMANSQLELMICSGGRGYIMNLGSNVITDITSSLVGAPFQCGYTDAYFVVLIANSKTIQFSALLDGKTWPATSVGQVSVFPDNAVGMIVDHREVLVAGTSKSVAYYDSGNTFPFDVIPGGFIEQGCGAPWSICRADNTVFWLGQDERGSMMAWRMNGYSPTRISTHPIESSWQQYSTTNDAVAYTYQESGHTFYVVRFPTANTTWCYDIATGLWHKRGFWNSANGVYTAHRSTCHAVAFGKHLVGDWSTRTIYQMSETLLDDFGNPIRSMRRSPTIGEEMQRVFHSKFTIDLEPGLGLPTGQGSNPVLMLRWSDDRGKTWSNERQISVGAGGKYRTRAIARKLGQSRYRIYEVSFTDPIPWRIVDAYLEATGLEPKTRLSHQLREVA